MIKDTGERWPQQGYLSFAQASYVLSDMLWALYLSEQSSKTLCNVCYYHQFAKVDAEMLAD